MALCTRAAASKSCSARAASPRSISPSMGRSASFTAATMDRFYDGIEPLSETERRAIAEAPDVDLALMRELWLGRTEGGGKKLVELLNLPSLNIRGMSAARTGAQASNVIPATATASIDIRLVKGIDHDVAAARVIDHIRKQGYYIVDHDPDAQTRLSHARVAKVIVEPGGYNAARTSMDQIGRA